MNKNLWCTISDGNQYWFQIFRNATSPKQWYLQIDVLDVCRFLESTLVVCTSAELNHKNTASGSQNGPSCNVMCIFFFFFFFFKKQESPDISIRTMIKPDSSTNPYTQDHVLFCFLFSYLLTPFSSPALSVPENIPLTAACSSCSLTVINKRGHPLTWPDLAGNLLCVKLNTDYLELPVPIITWQNPLGRWIKWCSERNTDQTPYDGFLFQTGVRKMTWTT